MRQYTVPYIIYPPQGVWCRSVFVCCMPSCPSTQAAPSWPWTDSAPCKLSVTRWGPFLWSIRTVNSAYSACVKYECKWTRNPHQNHTLCTRNVCIHVHTLDEVWGLFLWNRGCEQCIECMCNRTMNTVNLNWTLNYYQHFPYHTLHWKHIIYICVCIGWGLGTRLHFGLVQCVNEMVVECSPSPPDSLWAEAVSVTMDTGTPECWRPAR